MSGSEETARYFDRHAERLRAKNVNDKWEAIVPLVDRVAPSAAVLEGGAGTGFYTLRMLERGHQVTAVDISERSLDFLRRDSERLGLAGSLDTRCGDFASVAAGLGYMDLVMFTKTLAWFTDGAAIEHALEVAYDRLRPGVWIIALEPNGRCPFRGLLRPSEELRSVRSGLVYLRSDWLGPVLDRLPGARWELGYRYLIPGSVSRGHRGLAELDRMLCSIPILRHYAGFLFFAVQKRNDGSA